MAEKGICGCIIKVAFLFAIFILLPNAFSAKSKFLDVDNGDGTKTLLKIEDNPTKPQKGRITQNVLGIQFSIPVINVMYFNVNSSSKTTKIYFQMFVIYQ